MPQTTWFTFLHPFMGAMIQNLVNFWVQNGLDWASPLSSKTAWCHFLIFGWDLGDLTFTFLAIPWEMKILWGAEAYWHQFPMSSGAVRQWNPRRVHRCLVCGSSPAGACPRSSWRTPGRSSCGGTSWPCRRPLSLKKQSNDEAAWQRKSENEVSFSWGRGLNAFLNSNFLSYFLFCQVFPSFTMRVDANLK